MRRDKLRDKYFLGTLTLDEQRDFDLELEKDDAFRMEFEKMQEEEVELAVKHSHRDDIEADLRPQMLEWEREVETGRRSAWKYLSIAASFLLLVGLITTRALFSTRVITWAKSLRIGYSKIFFSCNLILN